MKNKTKILKYLFTDKKFLMLSVFFIFFFNIGQSICEDPFLRLGIPVLNPSKLFSSSDNSYLSNPMEASNNYWNNQMSNQQSGSSANMQGYNQKNSNNRSGKIPLSNTDISKNGPFIISIDEVSEILEKAGLSPKIGIQAVSRFLLTRNSELKSINAVFDKNQFSGLNGNESISFMDPEKTNQKVKSTSNLFFRNNLNNFYYEAYGTQENIQFRYPGWKSYKTLMVNKTNVNDRVYVTVFYPLDDMLPPFVINNGQTNPNDGINEVCLY